MKKFNQNIRLQLEDFSDTTQKLSIVKENNTYYVCGCFDVSDSISLILAEEKQKVADALNKHEKIIRKHLWCNEKCFDLLKKELKL